MSSSTSTELPSRDRRPSFGNRERRPSMGAPLVDIQGSVGPSGMSRPKHKRTATGFGAQDIKSVEGMLRVQRRIFLVHVEEMLLLTDLKQLRFPSLSVLLGASGRLVHLPMSASSSPKSSAMSKQLSLAVYTTVTRLLPMLPPVLPFAIAS